MLAGGGARAANAQVETLMLKGIDDIYRMRFSDSEADYRQALALDPGEPRAFLGLASIAWARYVYEADQSDPSLLPIIDQRMREAHDAAQARLKKNRNDIEAIVALGGAMGLESRLCVVRRQWVTAYFTGRKAVNLMRAAAKLDPHQYDALLGLGMYDYYSDIYPRLIGVLAKLVLGGNRLRGIRTLEDVAKNGKFSQNTAKILLVEIYTEDKFGSRDPARAVAITRELRAKYPTSAMMHSSELVALYEAGRYEEVVKGAHDYLARVKQGLYNPIEAGKGNVALGCGLWQLDEKEEALSAFEAASRVLRAGKPTRWAVWGTIRAGQLLDSMGRRTEAVQRYQKAASEPDTWGLRAVAKRYLSTPFPDPKPGPITLPD